MKFQVKCPDCESALSANNDPTGKIVKCPKCGGSFRVSRPTKVNQRPQAARVEQESDPEPFVADLDPPTVNRYAAPEAEQVDTRTGQPYWNATKVIALVFLLPTLLFVGCVTLYLCLAMAMKPFESATVTELVPTDAEQVGRSHALGGLSETPPKHETDSAISAPEAILRYIEETSLPPEIANTGSRTGIREQVVINALNQDLGLESELQHRFDLVREEGPSSKSPVRVALYEDRHSDILLFTTGQPEDLLFVQLLISVEAFASERDGVVTGDGAAAFGRCVQRLAIAVDPSWAAELYEWMNDNIPRVLLTKASATKTKRHLVAVFDTESDITDQLMLSFVIGLPEP